MADSPKPRGWGKFDALARKLMTVPKESADKIMAQTPKRKRRKKPK